MFRYKDILLVFAEICLSLETCSIKKVHRDGEAENIPCLFSTKTHILFQK